MKQIGKAVAIMIVAVLLLNTGVSSASANTPTHPDDTAALPKTISDPLDSILIVYDGDSITESSGTSCTGLSITRSSAMMRAISGASKKPVASSV